MKLLALVFCLCALGLAQGQSKVSLKESPCEIAGIPKEHTLIFAGKGKTTGLYFVVIQYATERRFKIFTGIDATLEEQDLVGQPTHRYQFHTKKETFLKINKITLRFMQEAGEDGNKLGPVEGAMYHEETGKNQWRSDFIKLFPDCNAR